MRGEQLFELGAALLDLDLPYTYVVPLIDHLQCPIEELIHYLVKCHSQLLSDVQIDANLQQKLSYIILGCCTELSEME